MASYAFSTALLDSEATRYSSKTDPLGIDVGDRGLGTMTLAPWALVRWARNQWCVLEFQGVRATNYVDKSHSSVVNKRQKVDSVGDLKAFRDASAAVLDDVRKVAAQHAVESAPSYSSAVPSNLVSGVVSIDVFRTLGASVIEGELWRLCQEEARVQELAKQVMNQELLEIELFKAEQHQQLEDMEIKMKEEGAKNISKLRIKAEAKLKDIVTKMKTRGAALSREVADIQSHCQQNFPEANDQYKAGTRCELRFSSLGK